MQKINNLNKIIYLFSFLLLCFIFLSNSFFYDEFDINSSALSSFYYLDIARSFPDTVTLNTLEHNTQVIIHAQRFLISYIIGAISYFFNFKIFITFVIVNFIFLFSLIILNLSIINNLKIEVSEKLVISSLIFLNPYILRYFIANPIMVNDLIFFNSISLLLLSFIKNNKILFYIAILFACASRQTSIILLIALLPYLFIKDNFFNFKTIFLSFLIYLSFTILNNYYVSLIEINIDKKEVIKQFIGILYFLANNFNFWILVKFISLPIFSFGPIIVLSILIFFKKINKIKVSKEKIYLIIIFLGFIAQPIIAGPETTGRNIIRLSSYGYVPLIYILFFNFKNKFEKLRKKIFIFIFIIGCFVWSLHPTFSKINLFF